MRLAGLLLAAFQEALRGRGIGGLPGLHGVGDGACHANGTQHVELVGVEQHLRLQAGGALVAAEAVRADALLHAFDAVCIPAFGLQNALGFFG